MVQMVYNSKGIATQVKTFSIAFTDLTVLCSEFMHNEVVSQCSTEITILLFCAKRSVASTIELCSI